VDKDLNLFSIQEGRKVYRTVRGSEWRELFLPKLKQELSKKDYQILEAFNLENSVDGWDNAKNLKNFVMNR
jgi:hypothetical protein